MCDSKERLRSKGDRWKCAQVHADSTNYQEQPEDVTRPPRKEQHMKNFATPSLQAKHLLGTDQPECYPRLRTGGTSPFFLWDPPVLDHPLADTPGSSVPSDAEAVCTALHTLQNRGVVVLGPLGDCRTCGWEATWDRFSNGNVPLGMTAVFWANDNEVAAFGPSLLPESTQSADRYLWSPYLLDSFLLYWCGDYDLIAAELDHAGVRFSLPFLRRAPITIHTNFGHGPVGSAY